MGVHPAFDVFDRINPDVFVCHASTIEQSILKNIKERPHLRVLVINDSQENVDKLEKEIGNSFVKLEGGKFCYLDECAGATKSKRLKAETFCFEGSIIPDIHRMDLEGAKVFSSVGIINTLSFCGMLPSTERFNGYKSCRYALVPEEEFYNAVVCGAIPIGGNRDATSTKSKSEILKKHTNYDFSIEIMNVLNRPKESEELGRIKSEIVAKI